MLLQTIDRYIATVLFKSIVVVLVALIGINSVFALVDEMGEHKAGYGLLEALNFIALTTPRRVYELAPFVIFVGALTGLSILASNSELTVLRTSGVSVNRLLGAVLLPVILLLLCSAAIGEYVAPIGEEKAEIYKAGFLKESAFSTQIKTTPDKNPSNRANGSRLSEYHWYKQSGLFMRAQALDESGNMLAIKQYSVNEHRTLEWIRTAESAVYVGDSQWRLKNVVETRFEEADVSVRKFDYLLWETDADPRQFSARVMVEPRKLSISDLLYQVTYMQREGLNSTQYELALWSKLFQPLSIIALTMLAVGFILGPLRNMGMGARLTVGIFIGLLFKYSQDLFGPLSVLYALPPWFAVLLPILITGFLGWQGLRRVN